MCVLSVSKQRGKGHENLLHAGTSEKEGGCLLGDREEGSDSLDKQPRMEEATLPDIVWVDTPPSDVSTRSLLSHSEPSEDEEEHEEREDSGNPPGSSDIEEGPRARALTGW